MFGYIVRRLISGLLVLLVVSVAVFALFFYGPSDPALAYCPETRCTPQRLENIRTSLGLPRRRCTEHSTYQAVGEAASDGGSAASGPRSGYRAVGAPITAPTRR